VAPQGGTKLVLRALERPPGALMGKTMQASYVLSACLLSFGCGSGDDAPAGAIPTDDAGGFGGSGGGSAAAKEWAETPLAAALAPTRRRRR
jgi:hypothetical protein